jgi:hypothetical protein
MLKLNAIQQLAILLCLLSIAIMFLTREPHAYRSAEHYIKSKRRVFVYQVGLLLLGISIACFCLGIYIRYNS